MFRRNRSARVYPYHEVVAMIEMIKGRKVLVLGVARSGRAALQLLLEAGAEKVIANDQKETHILQEELGEVGKDPRVEPVGGGHPESLLEGVSLIIKSPGIKPGLDLLRKAGEKSIPVYSEIELAYHFCSAALIGITGTNGKTTTVSLTGEIFRQQFGEVFMAGNIGYPLCRAVTEASSDGFIIAELSSFQLSDIKDFRAHIAVILNITPDHLDYHSSMEDYINAKKKILLNQRAEDWAVLNWDDPIVRSLSSQVRGKIIFFSRREELVEGVYVKGEQIYMGDATGAKQLCSTKDIKIPGPHNLENALAAIAVSMAAGLKPEKIVQGLKKFPGVPHRLEQVAEINGITFINDSKGTNPDATLKALKAFPGAKILIAGGLNKGSDFSSLVRALAAEEVKSLVLLGETAPLLASLARREGFLEVFIVPDLQRAVIKAFENAMPGDTVLFSPACASWDMFKNFEERGDLFKSTVFSLKEGLESEKCPDRS